MDGAILSAMRGFPNNINSIPAPFMNTYNSQQRIPMTSIQKNTGIQPINEQPVVEESVMTNNNQDPMTIDLTDTATTTTTTTTTNKSKKKKQLEDDDKNKNSKDEDNTTNFKNNNDDDDDAFNIKSNLPNAVRVREIIQHMMHFSLAKMLPADLKYVLSKEDKKLEENIQKLFNENENLWSIESLEAIFSKIVDKEDLLMHPNERKTFEASSFRPMPKRDKTHLKLFYPNLVRLIMALIAHIHNNTTQIFLQRGMGGSNASSSVSMDGQQFQTKNVVLSLWKQVLSEMNELHSIIIFANNYKDQGFLGDYPTQWKELIENRNREISSLNRGMHIIIDKINDLEKNINERDKAIEQIRAKYANQVDERELAISQRQGIHERLAQLLDVKVIVDTNIMQLKDRFPQFEHKKP